MSSIPPKQSPDSAPYEAPEGGGLVAMYNAASHAGAESFPVLKAFQDYIEAERAQARKRVVQLSIFFSVIMVVVVGGFLTAGIAMWRSNDARVNKLLEAVIEQKAAPAPVPAAIVQTSPVLEESVRQMSRVTTELQSNIDKKLDGVSDIATKVHDKVASQDVEFEKMRAELKRMQEQSEKLRNELAAVKESAQKPVPPPAAPAKPVVAATPKPAAPAPAVKAVPGIAATPAAPVAASMPPAVAAATPPPVPKPEPRDPRFPPPVKDPPVTPAGVTAPAAPKGMMASAIPVKTRNVGTIPWRVLIPD